MFEVGQDIDVRFDISTGTSTGTVWHRGTIIATNVNSNNELTYVVQLRWNYPDDESGITPITEFVFTAEDIATGAFRRI